MHNVVAVITAPRSAESTLDVFIPGIKNTMRLVTEHRIYSIVLTNGPVEQEFTFAGELLASVKSFSDMNAAKAWVENDVRQTRLIAQGVTS